MSTTDAKVALVTGGAGFIGSHLTRFLLEQPNIREVRVMDNLCLSTLDNLPRQHPKLRILEQNDIRDMVHCLEATRGVHYVFHQAALPSVPRSIKYPVESYRTNALGFVHVLEACRRNGCERVVYASSSSVYGGQSGVSETKADGALQKCPYAQTKWWNEEAAHMFGKVYGMDVVGLRYFNVYGPGQRDDSAYAAVIPIWKRCLSQNKKLPVYGNGANTRSFTFVRDVVDINWRVMTLPSQVHPGVVLNAGNPETTTLLDLGRAMADEAQVAPRFLFLPPRDGDILHSRSDTSRLQALIGSVAWTPLSEGVSATME